jgi:hypothetical protein
VSLVSVLPFVSFVSFVSLVSPTPIGPANPPDTVAAWNRYVGETEARLEKAGLPGGRISDPIVATGESIDIPSGTISDWHASTRTGAIARSTAACSSSSSH